MMEHDVISRLVCFARRYLAAFHNVNLSWEYLSQVPYQSLCIMESSFYDHRPHWHNRTRVISSNLHRHLRLPTTHSHLRCHHSLAR